MRLVPSPVLFIAVFAAALMGAVLGCDLLGGDESFDVPPERLVAMTAVFEETLEGGRPVHRLVVADVQDPSNYEVLAASGTDVGRSCFGPEKRRLLFEDNSESTVGSRAPIKLLDLKTREVRALDATGTLKGCVWRADGSGFYFAAASLAGLTVSTFYDLESGETEVFAQSKAGATVIPYGRKGRDSILVLSSDSLAPGPQDRPAFYFVDAQTGEYLIQIENEHLRFVPWENPDRGGWKYSAFVPAYDAEHDLVAFRRNTPQGNGKLTVTSLNEMFFEVYGNVFGAPEWGPGGELLFTRGSSVLRLDVRSGDRRMFFGTSEIEGVTGLRNPDY